MPAQLPSCLVVDDDPSMRILLRVQLEELGGNVVVAAGPDEAVAAIDLHEFSLVVVDRELRAELNGVDVLLRCLADQPTAGRYLMSAHVDAMVHDDAEQTHAQTLDKRDITPLLKAWAAIVS